MNEVTNFMYYIYCRWSLEEAIKIYGEDLGNHIWDKWCQCLDLDDPTMMWYASLDTKCKGLVVARANEMFK